MSAVPTPYDILPIPYFGLEPGPLIWLTVLVFFGLAMALAWVPRRSKRPVRSQVPFPFHDAEAAIKKLVEARTIRKDDVFDLSRKLKAVVHAYEDSDVSSLSPDELERELTNDAPASFVDFVRQIAALERLKYDANVQESQIRWTVSTLLSTLYEYKKSVRASLEERNAAASR